MLRVKIPFKVIENSRAVADEIHKNRAGNKDKFLQGDEARADRLGFQVEFAHCFAFKQSFPVVLKGKEVDEYDSLLAVSNKEGLSLPLKFDVKTSKDFLINVDQYKRKKVDAYIFEAMEFLDYSTGAIFLKIYGWILKEDVPSNSELRVFAHNGSQAYAVNRRALKNPKFLFSLIQPEGV